MPCPPLDVDIIREVNRTVWAWTNRIACAFVYRKVASNTPTRYMSAFYTRASYEYDALLLLFVGLTYQYCAWHASSRYPIQRYYSWPSLVPATDLLTYQVYNTWYHFVVQKCEGRLYSTLLLYNMNNCNVHVETKWYVRQTTVYVYSSNMIAVASMLLQFRTPQYPTKPCSAWGKVMADFSGKRLRQMPIEKRW